MVPNTIRHATRPTGVALVVVATLVVGTATAGAAGQTAVRLSAEEPLTVAETTAVDVVVDDADGGVGAYNVTVTLADPGTARIVDVTLHGDPSDETAEVDVASDGSSATAIAALADTDDTGSVTVVTVTLRGGEAGATDLDLTVTALGDETGHSYTTTAEGTELTVVGSDDDGDSGGDGSGNTGDGGNVDETTAAGDGSSTERNAGSAEDETADTTDGTAGADGTESGTQSAIPTTAGSAERPTTPTEVLGSTDRSATEPPEPLDSPTSGVGVPVPGFGILTGLLALVVAALALRRKG